MQKVMETGREAAYGEAPEERCNELLDWSCVRTHPNRE
jgi:hypothetical protein